MGAWGFEPLDSDQALDWLGDATSELTRRIVDLILKFEKIIEDQGGETERAVFEYAHEIRAAAFIVEKLNYIGEDLHARLAKALGQIADTSDWIEDWTEPDKVMASLRQQIEAMEKGPHPTTLMDNL